MSRAQLPTVERGVWMAPWLAATGEMILVGVSRHGRLVCDPVIVERSADSIEAADRLWERLDERDPEPRLALVK